ncbi:MAG: hypothetical protein V4662_19875 [Verrucomicrobiota bacterium]
MSAFKPPGQCPNCGEWVPKGAVACDDCGACAKSGWKENSEIYDGVDLPDDEEDFDYDDFVKREFGEDREGRPSLSKEQLWKIVAAILLAVMLIGYLLSAR